MAASGADVDLVEAIVLGQVSSTGKIVILSGAATDGSQFPVGLAIRTQTIADGTNEDIKYVNKGRVAESKINFGGAETLDTAVGPASNQRTIRALLNDLGLILETGTELTKVDNS